MVRSGTKRPCLPWKGVAERSESFKIMIASGNHTAIKRWLSVSETGGVCPSTGQYKNPLSQPVRAASSSSALSICTPPRRLQLLNLSGAPRALRAGLHHSTHHSVASTAGGYEPPLQVGFPNVLRICKKDCARQSSLLFQFPLFNLSGFFIQPQIAVVPGGHNLPFFQRLPHAAARLLPVGAVGKLARANPGGKIRERIL